MWQGNAKSVLQKAVRRCYSQEAQRQLWPVGAALSLFLLAELDQGRTKNNSNGQSTSTSTLERIPWSITTSCEPTTKRPAPRRSADLRRFRTLKRMDENTTKESLDSRYEVNWGNDLGEGSFGSVFLAKDRKTGEKVAVKKISKKYTNEDEFYREMYVKEAIMLCYCLCSMPAASHLSFPPSIQCIMLGMPFYI